MYFLFLSAYRNLFYFENLVEMSRVSTEYVNVSSYACILR